MIRKSQTLLWKRSTSIVTASTIRIIKILLTIIDKFKGGPVGIGTIATAIGEDPGTLEEVYEPFLIKEGFIRRTPRGREVTELAFKHLNRPLPRTQPEQPSLF